MKFFLLLLVLFFVKPTFAYEKERFDLIVDTDMAIDDWSALLYVLNHDKSNLLGVTIAGAGEAHCEPAMRNFSDLLYLVGREKENIPVSCGDPVPMEGFHTFPNAWRDDMDILSGIKIPKNPKPQILSEHAVEWMAKTLIKNTKPVVILTLGPLTNIAQLIQKYPEAAKKIKSLYIMGGAVEVPGNLIIPQFTPKFTNDTAEWNIWVDPLAAKIVFNSNVPINLISLDGTNKVRVTHEFAKQIKDTARSKAAKFYSDILDKNEWFIDSEEYYFWDPLAASAMYNDVCTYKKADLDVVVKYDEKSTPAKHMESFGDTLSYVIEQFKNYMKDRKVFAHLETGSTIIVPSKTPKNHQFCNDTNAEKFKDDFISVLNK